MSLILDALKRSRSETSSVPGVDTYHAPVDGPPAWRAYLPWVGLAIALVVVAWLLLERTGLVPGRQAVSEGELGNSVAIAPAQQAPRPAPAAGPAPTPRPVPAPRPAPRPAASPTPEVVQAEDLPPRAFIEGTPAVNVRVPPPSAAPEPVEEEAPDAAVADLYRARGEQLQAGAPAERQPAAASRQDSTEQEEQPLDLENMLQQARAELEAGEFVDHPAPFISSLSQQARDPIPTILYQRHDYSGQSGRASVVMNGKTLRVGGSPAPGVKLEEILPNSAVLSYRDTQFRLRALNSWVNL